MQNKSSLFVVIILLAVFLGLGLTTFMNMKSPKLAKAPTVGDNTTETEPDYNSNHVIISGSFDRDKFKSEDDWKKVLTSDQYNILRESGTEVPYTGALLHEERKGTFYSVGCDEPVFRSEQKYDSKTGWPSFFAPINEDALILREDKTVPGEPRIEVLDKCGSHLGHVFDDGPQPTGKRFCMNSIALKFVPDAQQ